MVTAGEGSSAPTLSAYEGGGGVGGKFQKRSFRRSRTTPYDRPITALRSPNWISKLFLDPATKLLAAGAQRFFSSLFRKRLPPPPPPLLPHPVANEETSKGLQDPVLPKKQDEVVQIAGAHFQNLTSQESCGISELEQLLKQKTFTRYEIDHLTKLLESKAVDLPGTYDVRRAESSLLKPVKLKDSLVENRREKERYDGIVLTPGISDGVPEEDITSPAELAKAYMGSQPSKGPPSTLSLNGQVIQENGKLLSKLPLSPNPSVISFATKTTGHVNAQKNGFTTPKSRGRSAIYHMARTPYLRMHPTPFCKGSGSNGNFLASPTLSKQDGEFGWKEQARKRSSAVLDDDLGSVGPIRRIRQKHALVSRKVALPLGGKDVSGGVQQPLSLSHKGSFMDDWSRKGSELAGGVEDTDNASTSYTYVPARSAESKLTAAREKSPSKLTPDMLSGQALKSLENTDSLTLLQGTQNGEKFEDSSLRSLTGLQNFTSQKQERAEENDSKESDLQPDKPQLTESASKVSDEHMLPSSIASASPSPTVRVGQVAQKKHAFIMSAREDFFDLDEHTYSSPAAESSLEERGEHMTHVAQRDPAFDGKLILDKPAVLFETRKTPLEPVTVSENSCARVGGGDVTGFVFPTLPLPAKPLQSAVHPPSPSSLDKSKDVEGPLASVSEVSTPKFSSWTPPTPLSSVRFVGAADLSLQVSGSGKREDSILQEGSMAKEQPETKTSVAFTSSMSSSISSILREPLDITSGPLHSSPSAIFSSSSLPSAGFKNQASADAPTGATTIVSTAVASHTSAVSSSLTWPAFQFGSSDQTSTAVSLVPVASDTEASIIKNKVDTEANASSASMSTVGSTSVPFSGTGSSLSGLAPHIDYSTVKSVSQDTGSESMLSRHSSVVGAGAAIVSESIPCQFGSSTSSTSGTSGVASCTPNNAPFSSLMPSTNLVGSSQIFGLSSSTFSSTSGSGSSSSMIAFGSTVPTVPTVGSSSSSAPNIFSFGAVSSGASPVISMCNSTSVVAPATFSFSGTSSSNMSSSACAATFNTLSSSSETSVASTGGAISTVSASSWQTPKPAPFGTTFSQSPSNGFSFGASSTFTAASTSPMVLGASTSSTSPGPVSSFATTSPSPSLFPTPSTFTNFPSGFMTNGNNDQMNTEDSMAEDPVQSPIAGMPVFSQQPVPSPAGFSFGSTAPAPAASTFQFGAQASSFQFGAQQSQSPLQGPGSFELYPGGSFSLGSVGGDDKSTRRIVRVNKSRARKK